MKSRSHSLSEWFIKRATGNKKPSQNFLAGFFFNPLLLCLLDYGPVSLPLIRRRGRGFTLVSWQADCLSLPAASDGYFSIASIRSEIDLHFAFGLDS